MAYRNKYGSGKLGDVDEISQTINSYAQVTAVDTDSVTIKSDTKITGMADFVEGAYVLLHVSSTVSETTYLGKFLVTTITAVDGEKISLASDPTSTIPSAEVSKYHIQLIAFGEFRNLTLKAGNTITPPVYSVTNYVGGIVAILCSETLKFDGGHISLIDCGIPPASKARRPKSTYHDAEADTANYSGCENSETKYYFLLNAGDGAAFINCKKMICHEDSRIGNPSTYGVQFHRGSSSSVTYNETAPANITNIGGSTILIAADTIENFTCKMIAKYRNKASTAGQGICRCYIASETKLRNDEGLYAYDCISNPSRIKDMHIKNFGNGSFGDVSNVTTQLNNYATVTAIDGVKLTYTGATTAGLAPITNGALVMVHFQHKTSAKTEDSGRFILANVIGNTGTILTLDYPPPNIDLNDYNCQIVSIPQCNNFTLSGGDSYKANSATPAYNGRQGGIFAIAVKELCTLNKCKIDLENKGGGEAYGRPGLAHIGNAQDSDKLPIGQNGGSIFILANKLTMSNLPRLVGTGSLGDSGQTFAYAENAGSGAHGAGTSGGYGSNAKTNSPSYEQGGHVMIVADTITGFRLGHFHTGGKHGNPGQGGRGGYNGGGLGGTSDYGGSSGWVFVYCNHASGINYGLAILDN